MNVNYQDGEKRAIIYVDNEGLGILVEELEILPNQRRVVLVLPGNKPYLEEFKDAVDHFYNTASHSPICEDDFYAKEQNAH